MRDYINRCYKAFYELYQIMKDETASIRKHSSMEFASRTVRELDRGDVVLQRSLDRNGDKTPVEMLRTFQNMADEVKDNMAQMKQYRMSFFRANRSSSSRDRGGRVELGGREERRSSSRYDRSSRDDDRGSSRYDKDRYARDDAPRGRESRDKDRHRTDRESTDRYGRSSREDRDYGRSSRSERRDDYGDRRR